jgi:hypothetical protein
MKRKVKLLLYLKAIGAFLTKSQNYVFVRNTNGGFSQEVLPGKKFELPYCLLFKTFNSRTNKKEHFLIKENKVNL